MNFRDFSIRNRIFIGFTFTILITVLLCVYLVNESHKTAQNIEKLYNLPLSVSKATQQLETDFMGLQNSLTLINYSRDTKILFTEKENLSRLEANILSELEILENRNSIENNNIKQLSITFKQYKILESELLNDLSKNIPGYSDSSIFNHLKFIILDLIDKNEVILRSSEDKLSSFRIETENHQHQILVNTIFFILLCFIIALIFAHYIVRSISRPLKEVIEITQQMAKGNLQQHIIRSGNDDITDVMDSLIGLKENLMNNATIADKIASGDFSGALEPHSEHDELGKAINKMTKSLSRMISENDKQTWLQQGQNELHKVMRGDQEIPDLASAVITFICKYLNSRPGVLYLLNNQTGTFELVSSYAFVYRKGNKNRILPGEGLVGQAALEQKMLIMSDLPDDYMRIDSSLGDTKPQTVTVVPFVFQSKTIGVIELAHRKELEPHELSFLEIVMEHIAINFNMALNRNELKNLLNVTQEQTELLQVKQEEMTQANEELEQQTNALKKSEEHLQTQQEELRVINEELEANTSNLKLQQTKLMEKNKELEAAQKEVERKAAELERTSRYKSEFLANMSHELRTPLNSLLILSQDLIQNHDGNLSNEQIESSTIIYKSGNDLLNLINEILDLSKIEAGKLELNMQSVSVSDIIHAIEDSFNKQVSDKGLRFITEIQKDIPETIFTDARRLDQILKNLMSNALKFTSKGNITISVLRPVENDFRKVNPASNDFIAFRVSDTGIGISPDIQEKIFEAFQQADGSISRKFGGTGLGLSISRELAQLLGGEITLVSNPDQGSSFTLIMPLRNSSIKENPAKYVLNEPSIKISPVPEKNNNPQIAYFKNKVKDDLGEVDTKDNVILLIEDDADFAKMLISQCHNKGFKCLSTPTGEEGLQMALQHNPSAIILDINLPGIDGWGVIEALKNNSKTRHIPVHMMSAYEETLEAYRKGAIGYLTKPIKMDDLDKAFGDIQQFIQKKMRELLLIEDDNNLRQTIRKVIGTNDIIITDVSTAKESIEKLQQHRYDCIVLDLGLPDMTGFELLKNLEARKIKIPPVIVYTGRELTHEENEELHQYANSIIIKGVKSEERLLDETALFLHRVIDDMPNKQKNMIINLYDKDKIFAGKKILVVDDDMRNVFALTKVLEQIGMQVYKADNGSRALQILNDEIKMDMVLMDIMMPVMDGYEAIGKIREQLKFKKLPVIALTAKAMKEDQAKCIAAGANDYIAKPVNLERLFSLMRVWLY